MPYYKWTSCQQNIFIKEEDRTNFKFKICIEAHLFEVLIEQPTTTNNTYTKFVYDTTKSILAIITIVKEEPAYLSFSSSSSSIETLDLENSSEIPAKWYLRYIALGEKEKKDDPTDADEWVHCSLNTVEF
jgi:hypothetical protein